MAGCSVRAMAPGFRSDPIPLDDRRSSFENYDLGTIVIHPVEGAGEAIIERHGGKGLWRRKEELMTRLWRRRAKINPPMQEKKSGKGCRDLPAVRRCVAAAWQAPAATESGRLCG